MPAPPAGARMAKTSRTSVGATRGRAATPPHTPAITRSSLLRSNSGGVTRSAGADDVDPAEADARIDHVPAAGAGPDDRVPSGVLELQHVHVAELRVSVHLDGDSVGHDDPKLADTDLGVHVQGF